MPGVPEMNNGRWTEEAARAQWPLGGEEELGRKQWPGHMALGSCPPVCVEVRAGGGSSDLLLGLWLPGQALPSGAVETELWSASLEVGQ